MLIVPVDRIVEAVKVHEKPLSEKHTELHQWLQENSLSEYYENLIDIGLDCIYDIQLVDQNDISFIEKPIHARKFMHWVNKFNNNSSSQQLQEEVDEVGKKRKRPKEEA